MGWGGGGYMVWGCAAQFGFSLGEDKVQVQIVKKDILESKTKEANSK